MVQPVTTSEQLLAQIRDELIKLNANLTPPEITLTTSSPAGTVPVDGRAAALEAAPRPPAARTRVRARRDA